MSNQKRKQSYNPPRGIRLITVENRPSPYLVQWILENKRRFKAFKTIADQINFAKSLATNVKEIGTDALRLDVEESRQWRAFKAELGADVAISDVLACWRKYGVKRERLPLDKAVEQYMAAKKAEGIAASTLLHYQSPYGKLIQNFGDRPIDAISRNEINQYLSSIDGAGWTIRTHTVRVRSLFNWLKKNQLIADSPCEGLKPVKVIEEEVKVLSVDDAKKLFEKNANEPPELLGRMALEAFAGLRYSSAAKIEPSDISLEERGVSLPALKIKTRRRQYIDGLPENLWLWIERSNPSAWTMTERQYLDAKSKAFVRADVPHPRNCLRHSFASYHVAANRDVSKTAVILCHSSPKMLWSHYKGRATEQDGKAYFQIKPITSGQV